MSSRTPQAPITGSYRGPTEHGTSGSRRGHSGDPNVFRAGVLKVWTWDPWQGVIPETLSKGPRGQNYFHNHTKTLLGFFPLVLYKCAVDFSRVCLTCNIAED